MEWPPALGLTKRSPMFAPVNCQGHPRSLAAEADGPPGRCFDGGDGGLSPKVASIFLPPFALQT
jgi:hypothetical protein